MPGVFLVPGNALIFMIQGVLIQRKVQKVRHIKRHPFASGILADTPIAGHRFRLSLAEWAGKPGRAKFGAKPNGGLLQLTILDLGDIRLGLIQQCGHPLLPNHKPA